MIFGYVNRQNFYNWGEKKTEIIDKKPLRIQRVFVGCPLLSGFVETAVVKAFTVNAIFR